MDLSPSNTLEIKGSLTCAQVKQLSEMLQNYVGQLCLCLIRRHYTFRRRIRYRLAASQPQGEFGSIKGFFGGEEDGDFMNEDATDMHYLFWRGNDNQVVPSANGQLSIPAPIHLLIEKRWDDDFRSHPKKIEYCDGAITHPLLANERFGLSEDFPLPPACEPSRDAIVELFMRHWRNETGEERIVISFHLGEIAYDIATRVVDIVELAAGFEHLGCTLPPDFRRQVADTIATRKQTLIDSIVQALAKSDTATASKLRQEFESTFGEAPHINIP